MADIQQAIAALESAREFVKSCHEPAHGPSCPCLAAHDNINRGIAALQAVAAAGVKVLPADDEAPRCACDSCGRKSWDAAEVGRFCNMPQPKGRVCSGIMQPRGVPLPAPARPLTLDRIDELWEALEHKAPVYLARAVERAHGIGVRVDDASLTDREAAFVMAVLRNPGGKRPLDDDAGYVREDGGSIWLRPEHQGLVTAVGSWKWEPTEKLLDIVRAALGVKVLDATSKPVCRFTGKTCVYEGASCTCLLAEEAQAEREAEAFVGAQWKAADEWIAAEWPHATDGERAVARSVWTEVARRNEEATSGVTVRAHEVPLQSGTDASSPAVRKAEDKLTESGSCIAARTALKESDQ